MRSNHTICYSSKASEHLSPEDIQDIFEQTNTRNNKNKVSGILIYSLGNFFQVLEGDQEYIEELYTEKIKNDTRHTDIYEVFHKEATKPLFANYSSSFQTIENSEQLDKVKEYLALNSISSTTSEKLSRLLKSFLILD